MGRKHGIYQGKPILFPKKSYGRFGDVPTFHLCLARLPEYRSEEDARAEGDERNGNAVERLKSSVRERQNVRRAAARWRHVRRHGHSPSGAMLICVTMRDPMSSARLAGRSNSGLHLIARSAA